MLNGRELKYPVRVPLADTFKAIVDSLPHDWTDLDLDLRIRDENRYVQTAVIVAQCNGQPYSRSDWHWRLLVAHEFGHAAAAQTVEGVLGQLDREGIDGELVLREVREGRVEFAPMWGRPESVRQEFARRRGQ
jgi:hypothetical protein